MFDFDVYAFYALLLLGGSFVGYWFGGKCTKCFQRKRAMRDLEDECTTMKNKIRWLHEMDVQIRKSNHDMRSQFEAFKKDHKNCTRSVAQGVTEHITDKRVFIEKPAQNCRQALQQIQVISDYYNAKMKEAVDAQQNASCGNCSKHND